MNRSGPERMLATVGAHFARTADRTGLDAPDPAVVAAMARVPRERFVPAAGDAYADAAQDLACGQTISQPFVVALMTTLLRPRPDHRVLEIGTGSGYQAALLGELVAEVHSVELVPELAAGARKLLHTLGYDNVHVQVGDGARGWPEHAPYDGILVTCGRETVPPALVAQLAPHGHLVMPLGPASDQRLVDITRDATGAVHTEDLLAVRFVPFVQSEAPHHERFATARGIGLRAFAPTEAQAFGKLALALAALVAPPERVGPERRVEFACSTGSGALLLRWLEEVLRTMQRQELAFHAFDVRLRGDSLRATGFGEPVPASALRPADAQHLRLLEARCVPAATGWCAECLVAATS